jgi:hypothetical protein
MQSKVTWIQSGQKYLISMQTWYPSLSISLCFFVCLSMSCNGDNDLRTQLSGSHQNAVIGSYVTATLYLVFIP